MIRSLVIIAVTGFVMSVVCISAAVAIGGPAIMNHGVWWMGPGGWGWDGHGHRWTSHMVFDDGDQPQATRKLAWTGEQLSVDLPADVRFTQADGPASLTIRGPQAAIDHVVVENGRIRLDGPVDLENLTIEVVAPKVTRFDVVGSGDLEIRDYRQDVLVLNVMAPAMSRSRARPSRSRPRSRGPGTRTCRTSRSTAPTSGSPAPDRPRWARGARPSSTSPAPATSP